MIMEETYKFKEFIYRNKILIVIVCLIFSIASYNILIKNSGSKSTLKMIAHFGGAGEYFESSLPAFNNAYKNDSSIIHLGLVFTKDYIPIVWGEPFISASKCQDTRPAFPDDPGFPYAGKPTMQLNYQQIITLNCGKTPTNYYKLSKPVPNSKILNLNDFYQYLKKSHITTKIAIELIPAEYLKNTYQQKIIANRILETSIKEKMSQSIMILSSNWDILSYLKSLDSRLTTGGIYSPTAKNYDNLQKYRITFNDSRLNIIDIARRLRLDQLLPQFNYLDGSLASKDWDTKTRKEFINKIASKNIQVIPWIINSQADFKTIAELYPYGFMTDYPQRMQKVISDSSNYQLG